MCLQASWRKNKLPSIEDRDQTNRVTILANSNHSHNSMTLTFSLQRTMAMTRIHAKYRGQRPAGSKQTDGRTRPIALPIPLARSIIIIRAFTTEGGMHAVQRLFLARPSTCLSKAGRILVYHRLFDRKTNTCLWFCWYAVCPHSRKRYRVGLSAYTTYVEYTK